MSIYSYHEVCTSHRRVKGLECGKYHMINEIDIGDEAVVALTEYTQRINYADRYCLTTDWGHAKWLTNLNSINKYYRVKKGYIVSYDTLDSDYEPEAEVKSESEPEDDTLTNLKLTIDYCDYRVNKKGYIVSYDTLDSDYESELEQESESKPQYDTEPENDKQQTPCNPAEEEDWDAEIKTYEQLLGL